eukprot:188970-Amphidinium_carterae.1
MPFHGSSAVVRDHKGPLAADLHPKQLFWSSGGYHAPMEASGIPSEGRQGVPSWFPRRLEDWLPTATPQKTNNKRTPKVAMDVFNWAHYGDRTGRWQIGGGKLHETDSFRN